MSQTRFKQTEKPKRCAFVGCVRPCKNKKRLKVGRVHVHTSSFKSLPKIPSHQYSNRLLPPPPNLSNIPTIRLLPISENPGHPQSPSFYFTKFSTALHGNLRINSNHPLSHPPLNFSKIPTFLHHLLLIPANRPPRPPPPHLNKIPPNLIWLTRYNKIRAFPPPHQLNSNCPAKHLILSPI